MTWELYRRFCEKQQTSFSHFNIMMEGVSGLSARLNNMSIFAKKAVYSIPEPFAADDIKIETSICTGEKTIGFYDKATRKLVYAELVRSESDIADFYKKYGLKWSGKMK